MLVVTIATSVFLYKNLQNEQKIISEQKSETDYLVKLLERFYVAGKVECYNNLECVIENGVTKDYKFDSLYIKNRADFIDFFRTFIDNSKEFRKNFIKKNELEYYFNINDKTTYKSLNVNKSGEFELNLNNFKLDDSINADLAFLTWYVKKSSYKTIIDSFKNISFNLNSKYKITNDKINLSKLLLEFELILLQTTKIELSIKNNSLEFRISDFDSLKLLLIEFKEIIKKFLENNQDIVFFIEILKHYEDIIDSKTKSISLSTNNIFDTKNVLFISSYKLETN